VEPHDFVPQLIPFCSTQPTHLQFSIALRSRERVLLATSPSPSQVGSQGVHSVLQHAALRQSYSKEIEASPRRQLALSAIGQWSDHGYVVRCGHSRFLIRNDELDKVLSTSSNCHICTRRPCTEFSSLSRVLDVSIQKALNERIRIS
jgi:hypothetical protein